MSYFASQAMRNAPTSQTLNCTSEVDPSKPKIFCQPTPSAGAQLNSELALLELPDSDELTGNAEFSLGEHAFSRVDKKTRSLSNN